MKETRKNYNYPLRLSAADAKAINELSKESRASINSIVTLCVRKALPDVRKALAPELPRITNVDPLPDKIARRLYRQRDDDTDSIRLFMDAQVTKVEE
jgi:hypothetical protein